MLNPLKKTTSLFKHYNDDGWLEHTPLWLSSIGVSALIVYAMTRMTVSDIGKPAETIFIYSGVAGWLVCGRQLRKSAVLWFLLASIVIPLISWELAHIHHPQWAESSTKVHRVIKWFIFIPVAFWLGGRTKKTFILWGLALFGILLAPWLAGHGWAELKYGLMGRRVDFGLRNAQHAAMLYAVGVLGLISFSHRIFAINNSGYWFKRSLWLLAFTACCFGVIVTQTRGIWLGLCVSSLFFMIFYFKIFWRSPRKYFNKISIILLVVTILTIVSIGTPLKKIVTNRLAVEKTTVMKIFQGDASDLSYSSAGIRVHYWIEAWSWIKQRPLVGWGGNGNRLVIKLSKEFPESVKKEYRHLHNSYLDLLVNFGALGGLLYLSLLAWLVVRGIGAWKSGRMPGDVLIFFLGFILFWLVINCFESYIFFSSGNFVFALICGGILTHIWKVDTENLKSSLP